MNNFKKALINTILVVIFTIIILLIAMVPYFEGETYYYQDQKVRKSLSGTIDTIVIGSSHALRSVKPVILNKELNIHSYNLSSPLMSMYGRYTMLKKEVERNPIKTVYLEISFNALTLDREVLGSEGDMYVLGRLDNSKERINFFINAFSKTEKREIAFDTMKRSIYSLVNFKTKEGNLHYETFGHMSREGVNLALENEKKLRILNTEQIDAKIKKENLVYFNKMVELCKNNDIRLVLIVTPVAESKILVNSNMDDLFSQYAELANKNGLEYYDFNLDKKRTELYPETDSFYDILHMSDKGAESFSLRFAEIINMVNCNEDVSSLFYKSYDELKENIVK